MVCQKAHGKKLKTKPVNGRAAAPLGFPVMAHGLDHFVTGMRSGFTGKSQNIATSQLLQKTGMSSQNPPIGSELGVKQL